MANGDTKTESYLRVAAEGTRADLPSDTCCNTKTQNLILGVANRIMDVEDEVEELKNNPDVVDIVDTYADLQAYDTSHLTDKDVIRVLADETHGGNSTYYRFTKSSDSWTFIGEVSGGGGIIELTSADYNWPENNPVGVAIWTLDSGVYVSKSGVKLYRSNSDPTPTTNDSMVIVQHEGGYPIAIQYNWGGVQGQKAGGLVLGYSNNSGTLVDNNINNRIITELSRPLVQDTGTSTTDVMSQNATTSMVFADPGTNYKVRIANTHTNGDYTVSIGTGSAGGNYSTQIGSGNASGNYAITIGGATANSHNSIAIGRNATAPSGAALQYSVALGAYSYVSRGGEVNIGTGNNNHGYNNTDYRVLGGVHDPVDAHDAATKGYVDANAGGVTFYSTVSLTSAANNVSLYSDKACTNAIQTADFFQAIRSGKTVFLQSGGSGDYDPRTVVQIMSALITNVDTSDAYDDVGPGANYSFGGTQRRIYPANPDPTSTNGFSIS